MFCNATREYFVYTATLYSYRLFLTAKNKSICAARKCLAHHCSARSVEQKHCRSSKGFGRFCAVLANFSDRNFHHNFRLHFEGPSLGSRLQNLTLSMHFHRRFYYCVSFCVITSVLQSCHNQRPLFYEDSSMMTLTQS